jgi:argininosuccinate synthase
MPILEGVSLTDEFVNDFIIPTVITGQWFILIRDALSQFPAKTPERVSGQLRSKFYKGNISNAGVWSDFHLCDNDLASQRFKLCLKGKRNAALEWMVQWSD